MGRIPSQLAGIPGSYRRVGSIEFGCLRRFWNPRSSSGKCLFWLGARFSILELRICLKNWLRSSSSSSIQIGLQTRLSGGRQRAQSCLDWALFICCTRCSIQVTVSCLVVYLFIVFLFSKYMGGSHTADDSRIVSKLEKNN